MSILRLSTEIANKIAAGEVVERPASVVKELVENAVDAGATQISVEIEGGGLSLIRVTDDGSGMDRQDAVLAFERHATSKIRSAEELFHIQTLGFRGEALPSIASVARIELSTREAGNNTAWSVRLEGGVLISQGPASHKQGTSVEVRDLFFNTPARLKYLKSANAETRRVEQVLEKLSLATPGVAISLVADGSARISTPGDGSAKSAARAILGKVAEGMNEGRASFPGAEVYVLVAPPAAARSRRQDQFIVVNGRPVSSTALFAAIDRGLEAVQSANAYPPVVVWLEVEPSRVDVNVHPAKAEVRFADEAAIFAAVRHAVSEASAAAESIPGIAANEYIEIDSSAADARGMALHEAPGHYSTAAGKAMADMYSGYLGIPKGSLKPSKEARAWESEEPLRPEAGAHKGSLEPNEEAENETRVIGQFMNTYILAEKNGSLLVIDQHVAHERILVDRFLIRLASGSVLGQSLLMPLTVELMPAEAATLREETQSLIKLGFDVEPFGMRSAILRSVPATGGNQPAPEETLLIALRDLAEGRRAPTDRGSRLMSAASEMACKGAVKAGMPLNLSQMWDILSGLFESSNPYRCPHGRPIMLKVDLAGIERGVGRRL